MINGTFYGNKVRIDTHTLDNVTSYHVKVLEIDNWDTVIIYSDHDNPDARNLAISLAKRLQTKVESL